MRKPSKLIQLLSAAALAAGGVLAPVTVDLGSAANGDRLFRLKDACGQADECESYTRRICSTHHQDWQDYRVARDLVVEEPAPVEPIDGGLIKS